MKESNKSLPQQHLDHEDEIDLIAIAKTIFGGRKEIIKITLVFLAIGLIVAFTSPAEYTSTIIVKPTISKSKSKLGNNLGGLAAMAGIKLGGGDSEAEIHPTLYPKIMESYSFQKELMESSIFVKELNSEVRFEEYYTEIHRLSILEYLKKYTIGLPGLIIKALKRKEEIPNYGENKFLRMSENDKEMMKLLKSQIQLQVDEKQGFIKLSATMPENIQSAQMVISAQNILQRKVIDHKLKKAEENLDFIEERYNEKKLAFEFAQESLAKYRDANKNINTAKAQTEAQRLESEYQLAFSVYSELAKQVETQKIDVKENTPVFAVLQNAVVPLEKSNFSKTAILVIWILLGFFLGITFTFSKIVLARLKEKWSE